MILYCYPNFNNQTKTTKGIIYIFFYSFYCLNTILNAQVYTTVTLNLEVGDAKKIRQKS